MGEFPMLGDHHQSMNREFVFSANDKVLKDSHCGMDDHKPETMF
jgi:hypothetical protein